jgi:hypothetical protein
LEGAVNDNKTLDEENVACEWGEQAMKQEAPAQ